MKKYVFLIAGLSAASALAHGRDPASIGNRLGDAAYMKATGLSAVEWASACDHASQAQMGVPYRFYGYSETERLMPEQTPASTETFASSADTGVSVSAGPSRDANYSATSNDTVPANSLTDNHKLADGANASASIDSDLSKSYVQGHSPIYSDSSDLSAAGAPASSERGSASSSASLPIGGKLSPTVSSDVEWASRIKSDLTKEDAANTSAQTFTSENLRNVNIHRANGAVVLSGTVPNETLKRNLETRIKELSGIRSIDNRLSVAPSADLPANGTSVPRD